MAVLLFALWLLLSGGGGWVSCAWGAGAALALDFFCRRLLGFRLREELRAAARLPRAAAYVVLLVWEMLKAGFTVMRLIYAPRTLRPVLTEFRTSLRSDGARAALADSITLTAGTITVRTEDGCYLIHALDRSLCEDFAHCGFARRLERLEG